MERMSATRITWRDTLLMPEDGNRYEAIAGALYVTPAPTVRHQRVSKKLFTALVRLLEEAGYGEVLYAPVGVEFPDSAEGVQPDIVYVSRERSDIIGEDYELEYGIDRVEVHTDAIENGERVLLVDDLIATGGTAEAAVRLVEKSGGVIVECCFIVDLPDIGGRKRIEKLGYKTFALCAFEGD